MKRLPRYLIILLVIALASFILAVLADLYLKNPQIQSALNFFGLVVAVVTAFLTVVYARKPTESVPSQSPTHRNRQALLQKVREFWVEGVLEKSLYKEVLIELGMQTQFSAVDNNPWDTIIQQTGKPDRKLDKAKILDVFSEFHGSLLILGEPGSGKTTTLLELARDLISLAIKNEHLPIPVVFNLSSWALERKPLAEWLVDELNLRYQVPKKTGQTWVDNDALTLLLDGLDEVARQYSQACVDTINAFRREHSVDLAVCSRITDYEMLKSKLQLDGAIVIQSLDEDQIEDYLKNLGRETAAVRELVKTDPDFRELMDTPLMLGIAMLAYQGMTATAIRAAETLQSRREYLFKAYVERTFEHRGHLSNKSYSQKQTIYWLMWLARCIVQYKKTEFYIESLQPEWLTEHSQRKFFKLAFGLGFGLVFGLAFELVGGLVFGLFLRLGGGQLGGFVGGLIFGFLGFMLRWRSRDLPIQSNDFLSWSSGSRSLFFSLAGGLVFAFVFGLQRDLIGGLVYGLAFGFLVGLVGGLKFSEQVDLRTKPNQGIHRSALNGLVSGLIGGIIVWLLGSLMLGIVGGLWGGLGGSLISGLALALLGGADAVIQHITLRIMLWWNGYIPWNYARFLDFCAERILLRKVGGGYIFIHRTLMEYFASLETEPPPSTPATPSPD